MKQFKTPAVMLWWAITLGGCGFSGCDTGAMTDNGEGGSSLTIMTWNVQALFDRTETGTEYEEYRESAGWSGEKYSGRLNAMAQAIGTMEPGAPDILALEEVENAGVLEELAGGALGKYGYKWSFFVTASGSPLGLGVLSRFPLVNTRAHSLSFNGETTPRPVMEVWVQNSDDPLALFICHWKSKLGGDDATEALRRASARILLRRMREIQRESPGVPMAVVGDLNENHDEFYRRNGAVISALLPDDPYAAKLTGLSGAEGEPGDTMLKLQADFLILVKNKPPAAAHFPSGALALYSPWGRELDGGSYYYQNEWETIDHFLLSGAFFDEAGWEFDSVRVADQSPFTNAKGLPNSYNPRTGAGLSDHLPLVLTVKRTNGSGGG
ncbi:MAG: endonuclease/exonuclease/phosphatase family protein [Treponema sp.]|jgi:endonuclease/exonuclease/phosphatase family metal-dependent hydrolase|nr:endonuclease/exonuclease/phosphatase family protein [Treponema sp.]